MGATAVFQAQTTTKFPAEALREFPVTNTEIPVRSSSGILGRISPGILWGNNKVIPSDGTITPSGTRTGTEHGSGEIIDYTRKRHSKLI